MKDWYRKKYPTEGETDEEAEKKWKILIKIIQDCITEEKIPTAFSYGVLVIIPKDDKGGVRGIGLLETIHKLVSNIINLRIAKEVEFDEDVHGFRRKRGTHTAIGEKKIKMQMNA